MGTGCHECLLTQITGKKHETSLFGNMGLHWATYNYPLERSSLSNTVETLSELNEIFPISLDQKTTSNFIRSKNNFPKLFPSKNHRRELHLFEIVTCFWCYQKSLFFFGKNTRNSPHFTHLPNTSFEIPRDVRAKTPAVSTLPLCGFKPCAVSVAHVAAARSTVEQYPGGCLDSAVGATQGVDE